MLRDYGIPMGQNRIGRPAGPFSIFLGEEIRSYAWFQATPISRALRQQISSKAGAREVFIGLEPSIEISQPSSSLGTSFTMPPEIQFQADEVKTIGRFNSFAILWA